MLSVTLLPILSDNYCYLLHGAHSLAIIDAGDAAPVIDYLESNALTPTHIFNTHHHGDHVGGNKTLKEKYNIPLFAPALEAEKIGNVTTPLHDSDIIHFDGEEIHIITTAGHTMGHICFHAPQSKILFSGDTLFSMGCGRLFEGSAEEMFHSLQRLKALPDNTKIYCGHEYTQTNAKFCLSHDASNSDLKQRYKEVKNLRTQNKPTLPTTIGLEKQTNIFLRAPDAATFQHLRTLKDNV